MKAITLLVLDGPGDTQDLLCCLYMHGWTKQQIAGGRRYQLISGGCFGKKVIQDVFEEKQKSVQRINLNCILLFHFGAKRNT